MKDQLRFYEEEIANLPHYTEEELDARLSSLSKDISKSDLSDTCEALLPYLYDLAKQLSHGDRVLLGDMIQEASIQCMTLLADTFPSEDSLNWLKEKVLASLNGFINEEQLQKSETGKIADKLNQLLETVEQLDAQNAVYTMEDLSEFLDIPMEEMQELLRIAGEN